MSRSGSRPCRRPPVYEFNDIEVFSHLPGDVTDAVMCVPCLLPSRFCSALWLRQRVNALRKRISVPNCTTRKHLVVREVTNSKLPTLITAPYPRRSV